MQSSKHHDDDETRGEDESPVVNNNTGIEYVASDFWEALSSEASVVLQFSLEILLRMKLGDWHS